MQVPNKITMRELLVAAQEGDSMAWSTLYGQHYAWMYAYALQICRNNMDARDAVQETFIRAFLYLHQLHNPHAFTGWLKTALIRQCYRIANKNPTHTNYHLVAHEGCSENEFLDKLELQSKRMKVQDGLSRLSENLQIVLLLRYFSDWNSYEQISAVLNIPVGTVRSRLSQARLKITENWKTRSGENDMALRESAEWSHMYRQYFVNVHVDMQYRERLINHFQNDLQVVFTSGRRVSGKSHIEKLIEEDMRFGSRFSDIQVVGSRTITIVETKNINSSVYPDHCPENSVFVLYRNKNKVGKIHLYNS